MPHGVSSRKKGSFSTQGSQLPRELYTSYFKFIKCYCNQFVLASIDMSGSVSRDCIYRVPLGGRGYHNGGYTVFNTGKRFTDTLKDLLFTHGRLRRLFTMKIEQDHIAPKLRNASEMILTVSLFNAHVITAPII